MKSLAGALLIIAGVVLFGVTPSDAFLAGMASGGLVGLGLHCLFNS